MEFSDKGKPDKVKEDKPMAKKEIKKVEIPLHIGDTAEFTKTVTETDVYLFGGITADYSQMHFNEEFMKKTMYGTRIVHGILTFAIGCTASTKIQEQVKSPVPSASYGYDRLRFIRPVFFGDTLTCRYTVDRIEEETNRTFSKLEIFNQHGEIVVAAIHILKFFPLEEEA